MVSTFRIVLRQDEGLDAHPTREFDLALDSKFAIGRASKNISKGYLQPAKNNVYIDSPVVSREHAILTANAASGMPQVFITDTKSMHGTQVNGSPLVPHTPKQLFNGDQLQFGVNISRNESYFVAFKYTFKAELSTQEPFSRGFTVPEADSDDEVIDFTQAGCGSQLNPLVLDDSDAASEHEGHEEDAERPKDNADVTLALLEDEEGILEMDTSSLMDEEDDAADSAADDLDDSEFGELDDSDAASTGSAPNYTPTLPPLQDAQYFEEVEDIEAVEEDADAPSIVQVQTTSMEKDQPTAPSLALYDAASSSELFSPAWQDRIDHVSLPSSTFDDAVAPPLPPRPSQKRQRVWDEVMHEETDWMSGAPSDTPAWTHPGGLAQEYRTPPSEDVPVFPAAVVRIQTPPPTMPVQVVTGAPLPLTAETRAFTPEVVDEQPPTPTSINSRKRSADDAFDEEIEEIHEPKATDPEIQVVAAEVAVPTVEQIAPQPQRHIAQPRSILRRVLYAAKVMVPATALGAVFTVGALTALPESFFTTT